MLTATALIRSGAWAPGSSDGFPRTELMRVHEARCVPGWQTA